MEAQQVQSQTQAALAGLQADGRVADYLLQTCSHDELQSFASQVLLMPIGSHPFPLDCLEEKTNNRTGVVSCSVQARVLPSAGPYPRHSFS